MSVGDSAEEFMLILDLWRERLLMLSSGLSSKPLKFTFFVRWEPIEVLSQFFSHQPPSMF